MRRGSVMCLCKIGYAEGVCFNKEFGYYKWMNIAGVLERSNWRNVYIETKN